MLLNDLLLRRRLMMSHNDKTDLGTYLTFNISSPGDINWASYDWEESGLTIEYSKNGGPWTEITATYETPPKISVNAGDNVRFRGDNSAYCKPYAFTEGMPISRGTFRGSTCGFSLSGNIMSLVSSSGFEQITTLSGTTNFSCLFEGCDGLTSAEELILPVTAMTEWCCSWMFSSCSSLTTPPSVLPAMILEDGCYYYMFEYCDSLESTPLLPATVMAERCYGGMFYSCESIQNSTLPRLNVTTLAEGCYLAMFYGCTSLTAVPSNYLPITTLAEGCYAGMFHNCSSLVSIPELPALTLAESCYSSMFRGCAITTPPVLPATTLAVDCYQDMFSDCENLTSAPVLPVMNLAMGCYTGMFSGCTALTTAPELPATTLAAGCYEAMFRDCKSLTAAPELPATVLVSYCYQMMFYGCNNLNYIKCLATTINSSLNSVYRWVGSVAASGTFVKNPSTSTSAWGIGNDGIPSGWAVVDA